MSKLEVWKKILPLSRIQTMRMRPRFKFQNFFVSPTLTSGSFATLWATRLQSTLLESPEQGTIRFSLKKSVTVFELQDCKVPYLKAPNKEQLDLA